MSQGRRIDRWLVKYGTFVGQLPCCELSTSDSNKLAFCKRFPVLGRQRHACDKGYVLIVAMDGKPAVCKAQSVVRADAYPPLTREGMALLQASRNILDRASSSARSIR